MNNKILLLLTCFFLSFTTVHALEYTNSNTKNRAFIDDATNILTSEEEQKLLDEIIPLTEYGHIGFHSTNQKQQTIKDYAESYYYSNYGNQSGTIFIIDIGTRYVYIVSSNNNYQFVTDAKAKIITDNVYKYATKNEYYKCAKIAFEQISAVLHNQKIAEPMKYISNGIISLIAACIINYFIIEILSEMKSKSEKKNIATGISNLRIGKTSVMKTGQEKIYSPRVSYDSNDSSGGGFSSGGSSGGSSSGGGGGFSGGGGGHRF